MSIVTLFDKIRQTPSGHAFTVLPLTSQAGTLLGADGQGRPTLFVRAAHRSGCPPLRTSQVSLRLGAEYVVATPGGPQSTELFHALSCEAAAPGDTGTFLVLVDAFLTRQEGRPADEESLVAFFRSVVRLFSTELARDLDAERQGLWGELFLMSHVRGFSFWAPFWHSEVTRRFDFSAPGRRLETKTALGTLRVHHFAHRQLFHTEGEEIMVASLLLREEDSGLSLKDLIAAARAALQGTDHALKLERSVRHAGMGDASETGPCFDLSEAVQSLAWFRAEDVPHFRLPEPPGVSDTHYRVDLSTAPRVDEETVSAWVDSWGESRG